MHLYICECYVSRDVGLNSSCRRIMIKLLVIRYDVVFFLEISLRTKQIMREIKIIYLSRLLSVNISGFLWNRFERVYIMRENRHKVH